MLLQEEGRKEIDTREVELKKTFMLVRLLT